MNETNPYTNKPLNPTIEVTQNGKKIRVEYFEDHMKKTPLFDDIEGHGVWRLNEKLTPQEWCAVKKYFKKYNGGYFQWGSPNPDMVIIILTKMRRQDLDQVVVRHKITAKEVQKLKETGANIQDGITGEWLIPHTE